MLAASPAEAAGSGWQPTPASQTFPTSQPVVGISYVDPLNGWAAGGQQPAPPTPTCGNGFVMHSTDGGNSYVAQGLPAVGLAATFFAIKFTDLSHGWAVGCTGTASTQNGLILFTTNGGATWQQATIPAAGALPTQVPLGTIFTNVFFLRDNLNGWATGQNGVILHSIDGGQTWLRQATPVSTTIQSVYFSNPLTGWAVGSLSAGNGVILVTPDGGATWTRLSQTQNGGLTQRLNGVSFVPGTTDGWAVGSSGTLAHTVDGINWTVQTLTSVNLRDIQMLDSTHGWAVGDSETVIFFNGTGWAVQFQPTPLPAPGNQFLKVTFVDACHGWTGGNTASFAPLVYSFTCALTAAGTTINATAGQPFTGTVATTSGGSGIMTADINWGDGTPTTRVTSTNGNITGTHTWAAAGTYAVTVTITDSAGNPAGATSTAIVSPAATPFSGAPPRRTPLSPLTLFVAGALLASGGYLGRRRFR